MKCKRDDSTPAAYSHPVLLLRGGRAAAAAVANNEVQRKMSKSEERNKTVNKQVRMTPEEWAEIRDKAEAFGVSVPQYFRDCALDRPLRSKVEHLAIKELAQANADQGRLGGILKKWLTGDWKTADGYNGEIGKLLRDIEATQGIIRKAVQKVAGLSGE